MRIGFMLMSGQLRIALAGCLSGARGILFISALLGFVAGGHTPTTVARCSETMAANTAARVTTRREGNVVHVLVENSELSEVTVTFEFSPTNLRGTVSFPYTATFRPGKTEAFTLAPIRPDEPWHYSYTNYLKLGSKEAAHDDSVVYQLPYDAGRSYRVSQGYNGGFSHHGGNQCAIDWKMPEGTPVRAARGGGVVKVKDDSNAGGGTIEFDACNNYVLVRHEDGTLGHYCHLQKNGVRVAPGQTVVAGEVLALSGNTGFSSGPHLHFSVFKTLNGRERVTIPVRFEDADGGAVTLVEGRQYRRPQSAYLSGTLLVSRP